MRSRLGISLVSAIVGMLILSIAGLAMFGALGQYSLQGGRLERSLQGDRVLADFAVRLQAMPYDRARSLCTSPDRFQQAATSPCPSADQTRIAGQTAAEQQALNRPLPVDRPLDWNGDPVQSDGKACISVTRCQMKGNAQMLELELEGFWLDSKSGGSLKGRTLSLRMAR